MTSVAGIVQAPILFRHLPPAELGVWYLLFAVATLVNLSDLGLPTALSRAISFRWGRELAPGGDRGTESPSVINVAASRGEIYGSALAATVVLSLAAAAAAVPAALLYFHRTLEPGPLRDGIALPLVVFVGGIVLNLVSAIPSAYLTGAGDVAWDAALRTAIQVGALAAIWVLVPLTRSLLVLCAIYALQCVALLLGGQLLLWWRHPELRFRDARPRAALARTMYSESLPFFLSRIGVWLAFESTLLIGAYFLGSTRIADFAVLRNVVMMGANLTAAIVTAASPHVSAAHAAGDRERVRGLYLAVMRYSLVANAIWTIGTIFWARTVLDTLVGPGHFLGLGVLLPLCIASFLGYHAGAHGSLTWSVGTWPFAPVTLAAGALNIALATAGCALFGFVGLAIGPALAEASTVDWIQVVLALRRVEVPVRAYLRETVTPFAGYALALTATAGGIRWAYDRNVGALAAGRAQQVAWAACAVCATGLAGAILAWFLGLRSSDRTYFLGLARGRR